MEFVMFNDLDDDIVKLVDYDDSDNFIEIIKVGETDYPYEDFAKHYVVIYYKNKTRFKTEVYDYIDELQEGELIYSIVGICNMIINHCKEKYI